MIKSKYIRIETGIVDAIVIFPDMLQHADMAQGQKVISAGFIYLDSLQCFGKSVSLGLEAQPEDTNMARRQFVGHRDDWPEEWLTPEA